MSLLAAGSIAPLPDNPTPATTFYTAGLDRLDVTAYGFDVQVEILAPGGGWADPQRVTAGLHRGFTGLAQMYRGGAAGFRLSNWTAGKAGSCDYDAAGIE
jgi:hypothetical protein